MLNINKWIQNILLSFIMSCSITSLFEPTTYHWTKEEVFHIPYIFIIMFIVTFFISEDVRDSFKKVLRFD